MPADRIDYDPTVMEGYTERDKKIIARALESGRELEVDVTELGLSVVDRGCRIALAQYISYDPDIMIGKTNSDEETIKNALDAGRRIDVVRVESELRVIDVACFIATATYRSK